MSHYQYTNTLLIKQCLKRKKEKKEENSLIHFNSIKNPKKYYQRKETKTVPFFPFPFPSPFPRSISRAILILQLQVEGNDFQTVVPIVGGENGLTTNKYYSLQSIPT